MAGPMGSFDPSDATAFMSPELQSYLKQLHGKQRKSPSNVGEGLTYLGETLRDAWNENRAVGAAKVDHQTGVDTLNKGLDAMWGGSQQRAQGGPGVISAPDRPVTAPSGQQRSVIAAPDSAPTSAQTGSTASPTSSGAVIGAPPQSPHPVAKSGSAPSREAQFAAARIWMGHRSTQGFGQSIISDLMDPTKDAKVRQMEASARLAEAQADEIGNPEARALKRERLAHERDELRYKAENAPEQRRIQALEAKAREMKAQADIETAPAEKAKLLAQAEALTVRANQEKAQTQEYMTPEAKEARRQRVELDRAKATDDLANINDPTRVATQKVQAASAARQAELAEIERRLAPSGRTLTPDQRQNYLTTGSFEPPKHDFQMFKREDGSEIAYDRRTGQWVKPPRDTASVSRDEQKAHDAEIGKQRAQAKVALPNVIAATTRALDTIAQIRTHPGASRGVGVVGSLPSAPGTDTRGFDALVGQAKGQTFLQAFESLKGAGAISEGEGKKATEAIARLDQAQSKTDFFKAIKDLESVIMTGLEVAKRRAVGDFGAGGQPVRVSTPEEAALLPSGTRFIGHDGVERTKH